MKKSMLTLVFISCVLSFSTNVDAATISNKNNARKSFDFHNFNTIEVKGIANIDVKYAKNYGINITAPKYLFNKITFIQKDGAIYLSGADINKAPFSAEITTPTLEKVELSGVINFHLSGFELNTFELNARGMISSIGDHNTIQQLILNSKGTTNTDFGKSNITNVNIILSGAGRAKLNMTGGKLSGSISGMSILTYSGKVSSLSVSQTGMTKIMKD